MAEEIEAAGRPEFVFHAPARLTETAIRREISAQPPGLIVVDDVDLAAPPTLPARSPFGRSGFTASRFTASRSAESRPPVALLSRGGPPELRNAALAQLGLAGAVVVGAGWDRPDMTLVAYDDCSEAARRRRLTDTVRYWASPTLVVAPAGGTARSIAAVLTRNALPSAVLSTSLRPATVADRLAAARRKQLAALVLDGPMTPEARALIPAGVRFRAVGIVDLPPTAQELHSALLPSAHAAAVFACSPDSGTSELSDWLHRGRCRWADLLDRFGESISVPCGRCDLCGIA